MAGDGSNGSEGKVVLNVQSDLILNLTMQDQVSSTPEPILEKSDISENAGP